VKVAEVAKLERPELKKKPDPGRTTITLPTAMAEILRAEADRLGCTISSLMSVALYDWIERNSKRPD
jgi:hypothetical protein